MHDYDITGDQLTSLFFMIESKCSNLWLTLSTYVHWQATGSEMTSLLDLVTSFFFYVGLYKWLCCVQYCSPDLGLTANFVTLLISDICPMHC